MVIDMTRKGRFLADEKEREFVIQEFVPQSVFTNRGAKSVELLNLKLIEGVLNYREWVGSAVIINNWIFGGKLHFRGFRPSWYEGGSKLSQHYRGAAFDHHVPSIPAMTLWELIMDNQALFLEWGFTTIEHISATPTWIHLDQRIVLKPQTELKIVYP